MFDIVGKRPWFFSGSLLLVVACIVVLAVVGLKPGIDFTAGSITTLQFEQPVSAGQVQDELFSLGFHAQVDSTPSGNIVVHTVEMTPAEKDRMKHGLEAKFGPVEEKGFENVNPVIARETARIAGIAVAIASVGILLYVTWAFRRMPRPFRYGTCAIIALLHDVVVVLGVFALLGAALGWEVNLMFITGVLAVIGYSVNNTVVVFDRIRENLRKGVARTFEGTVNLSLVETMGRSLNTSLTTLFVVLALVLFVGVSIQNFAVVLLIGVVAGTYSSLFVAPNLLAAWESGRWWGSLSGRQPLLASRTQEG